MKNFKKKRTVHLIRFLLRQGEPGTSQYIQASYSEFFEAESDFSVHSDLIIFKLFRT